MRYSIITVSFNSEKTIERTLKSVLVQEVKDYEYIIVDGASQDSTMKIVKRYEPLFEGRLRWISEPDKGIYNAMNKGIAMANGDIVGIVNSDDWLEVDSLLSLNKCIEQNAIDVKGAFVITGNMRFHYDTGESVIFKTSYERYEKYAKVYRMGLNHPATFVSKQLYETIGVFDENLILYADADLMVRCYQVKAPIYFSEDVLSNMSDGGASNQRSKHTNNDVKYILKKYCKTENEYYWLLAKRRLLGMLKRLPYSWLIKYRHFQQKKK